MAFGSDISNYFSKGFMGSVTCFASHWIKHSVHFKKFDLSVRIVDFPVCAAHCIQLQNTNMVTKSLTSMLQNRIWSVDGWRQGSFIHLLYYLWGDAIIKKQYYTPLRCFPACLLGMNHCPLFNCFTNKFASSALQKPFKSPSLECYHLPLLTPWLLDHFHTNPQSIWSELLLEYKDKLMRVYLDEEKKLQVQTVAEQQVFIMTAYVMQETVLLLHPEWVFRHHGTLYSTERTHC